MKRLSLTVAGLAALSLVMTGCAQKSGDTTTAGSGSSDSAGKTIRVLISGDTNIEGLWKNNIAKGFEAANPGYKVDVTLDLHGEHDAQNMAKLSAAVQGGKDSGYDLIDGGFVTQAAISNLLEKADKSTVKGLADVPDDTIAAGSGGGIPYRGSSVLLAYNSTKVPNPPKTLDELLAWIKANKGQFTYNSPKSGGSGGSFVTTVLDKYVPEDVQKKMRVGYDQTLESNWDKGFEELRGLNQYVFQSGVYPNGNKAVLQLLGTGQISMAPVWSDMFISGQKSGDIPAEVKATQISNPSFTGGAAYLGIPKGTPNKDAAAKLVDYVLSPDAQNMIATTIAGYPVIPLDKLPAATQEIFKAAHPETLRPTYFSQMNNDMQKLWDDKVPGK